MIKKIIFTLALGTMLVGGANFNNSKQIAYSSNTINFDVDVIRALSHKNGEKISFVNKYIKEYWNSDASDIETLKSLYEYNNEIASFANNSFNSEYCRTLYGKWDDFKPVNNTLNWTSNIKADSYDIVVSLNADLTEVVYEEKGLKETSYVMNNPFSNKHYFWQITAHRGNENIKSTIFDFYSEDYKRTIDVPSVSNTRDVGGFVGQYGEMKEGLIYRSARFDDIDDIGKEALSSLNIQTDLDLRGKGEGFENPAQLPNYYLRSISGAGYSLAFNNENRASTIEAIRVFANPNNYPIMFHCAVGRDRTGTVAMILQALCGASKEYIIHDYYTSVFSVTGAYDKTLEGLNLNAVNETLNAITNNGQLSLSEGAENFLKEKNGVGLSEAEINSIRNIWSGKVEAINAPKLHKADDNYEGKAFVKIQSVAHKDIAMMVDKGVVINEPYQLNEGFGWYSNKEKFDFSSPVNETTFIYADYLLEHTIVIHFVGLVKKDITIKAKSDDVITFNEYMVSGYNMSVLLDNGKEISRLKVDRDAYINIIYFKN